MSGVTMQGERPDWPTPRGPYSGNAAYDIDLRPPLVRAWEQPIAPAPHDPSLVADGERILVPTAGADVVALHLRDGSTAWQARACRRREYETYLAGPRAFAFRGIGGEGEYETSVLDVASGEIAVLKMACVPQGIHARDGVEWLWLRDDEVRLDHLEVRPRRLPLFGKVHRGRLFGRVGMTSEPRLGCWDAARDEPEWELDTQVPEDAVCAGDEALVTHGRDGHYCVRSVRDGRLLWRVETIQTWESHTPWVITGSRALHVEEEDRLVAYDLATGAPVWERMARDGWGTIVATRGLVWTVEEVATKRYELVALDVARGAEAWRLPTPQAVPRCRLALSGASLLCDTRRSLSCWRAEEKA